MQAGYIPQNIRIGFRRLIKIKGGFNMEQVKQYIVEVNDDIYLKVSEDNK